MLGLSDLFVLELFDMFVLGDFVVGDFVLWRSNWFVLGICVGTFSLVCVGDFV